MIMERVKAIDSMGSTSAGPTTLSRFPSERASILIFKDHTAPVPTHPPAGLPPRPNADAEPPLWAQIAASRALTLTVRVCVA